MTHSMDPGLFGDGIERDADRYAAEQDRRDHEADYWEARCMWLPEPIDDRQLDLPGV